MTKLTSDFWTENLFQQDVQFIIRELQNIKKLTETFLIHEEKHTDFHKLLETIHPQSR